jgi:uncharacterized protein
VSVRRLDRDEARKLPVRAQLLDATKPADLVDLVDHLTLLQVDPTAAIAPNADLVAWSRLGPSYQPADLTCSTMTVWQASTMPGQTARPAP